MRSISHNVCNVDRVPRLSVYVLFLGCPFLLPAARWVCGFLCCLCKNCGQLCIGGNSSKVIHRLCFGCGKPGYEMNREFTVFYPAFSGKPVVFRTNERLSPGFPEFSVDIIILTVFCVPFKSSSYPHYPQVNPQAAWGKTL